MITNQSAKIILRDGYGRKILCRVKPYEGDIPKIRASDKAMARHFGNVHHHKAFSIVKNEANAIMKLNICRWRGGVTGQGVIEQGAFLWFLQCESYFCFKGLRVKPAVCWLNEGSRVYDFWEGG
jgi:hypothetical protein